MPLRLGTVGALAVCLLTAACSDWFSSDDALYTGPSGVTLRADETFPSVASVPDRPDTQSTEAQRSAAIVAGEPLPPTVSQPATQPSVAQTQALPAVPGVQPVSTAPQLPQGPVLVATINFVIGSDNLDARDRGILRNVVTLIAQTGRTVTIVGHASARTAIMEPNRARAINYTLSVQRATAVAQALVNLGAPADRVLVYAVGDNQPVFHEWMETGQVGNQRAEIYLN